MNESVTNTPVLEQLSTPLPAPVETQQAQGQCSSVSRILAVGLLLLLAGASFYLFYQPGDSDVVAVVDKEQVRQGDVDVQVALRQALNEALYQNKQTVDPGDTLNQLVEQRLALQDIAAHHFPAASNAAVSDFINSVVEQADVTQQQLSDGLAKHSLARSVLSDSVRNKLTVDAYVAQVVTASAKDDSERQDQTNAWRSSLYKATVSYPHALRDDSGPLAKVGRLAPEISGTTLAGQQFALSKLKGKPVLVNFWATWCGYCKREMPKLAAAYLKYKDSQQLQMLALDSEDAATADKVGAAAKELGINFPVLLDDSNLSLAKTYRVYAYPATYFIGKDGRIADFHLGEMDDATLANGLATILK